MTFFNAFPLTKCFYSESISMQFIQLKISQHCFRFWLGKPAANKPLPQWQWNVRSMMPQIAKFTWPTWGPPGSCRTQMGPMLAPWTLLSGTVWSHQAAVCDILIHFMYPFITQKCLFVFVHKCITHLNHGIMKNMIFFTKCGSSYIFLWWSEENWWVAGHEPRDYFSW